MNTTDDNEITRALSSQLVSIRHQIYVINVKLAKYGSKASVDYSLPRCEELRMSQIALVDNYNEIQNDLDCYLGNINEPENLSELLPDNTPPVTATIEFPPGTTLSKIAELLISPKKYERDCMAALADWHEEYFEALNQERGRAKMTAIRIRHTYAFLKATGLLVVLETAGKLITKLLGKIGSA